MLDRVKLALRIGHTALDDTIRMEIEAARQEMIRVGIAPYKTSSEDDPLISRAIITFCRGEHTSDVKQKEGFQHSFEVQLDNLRKSVGYREEPNDE